MAEFKKYYLANVVLLDEWVGEILAEIDTKSGDNALILFRLLECCKGLLGPVDGGHGIEAPPDENRSHRVAHRGAERRKAAGFVGQDLGGVLQPASRIRHIGAGEGQRGETKNVDAGAPAFAAADVFEDLEIPFD